MRAEIQALWQGGRSGLRERRPGGAIGRHGGFGRGGLVIDGRKGQAPLTIAAKPAPCPTGTIYSRASHGPSAHPGPIGNAGGIKARNAAFLAFRIGAHLPVQQLPIARPQVTFDIVLPMSMTIAQPAPTSDCTEPCVRTLSLARNSAYSRRAASAKSCCMCEIDH
jgi:hypothetical protein